MYVLSLFYRDASNYKFDREFAITDAAFNKGIKSYLAPGEPLDKLLGGDEPDVKYTDFGITEEEFHGAIGYAKNEDDHPWVIITEIKFLPDEPEDDTAIKTHEFVES